MDYLQYREGERVAQEVIGVLNLIINGLPSILIMEKAVKGAEKKVLNLIINGLPSIFRY